ADANIVLWGSPAENPLLAQISDYLPLTVSRDESRRFVFGGNLQVSVQGTARLGVLQEIASPWTSGRRVLVVSGTSPDNLSLAVGGLEQPNLSDNLALVSLAPAATPTPGQNGPRLSVTTYQIGPRLQLNQRRRGVDLVPMALTAILALLALGMAFSMAYQAFVREPREQR
ncbi:MAG: hypothetical protein KGJ86_20770, partial [Chloroflexota bacterium]|nr:hypothetical protein [Chloroflexota bacterium]